MAVILYSPASPYSAKVRMAAQWCGVEAEARVVDTGSQPAELIAANPLGKIPVLIGDDGDAVFRAGRFIRARPTSGFRSSGWRRWPTGSATA
jgi:glutaredoxin 2